jgi:hypothetical protein
MHLAMQVLMVLSAITVTGLAAWLGAVSMRRGSD